MSESEEESDKIAPTTTLASNQTENPFLQSSKVARSPPAPSVQGSVGVPQKPRSWWGKTQESIASPGGSKRGRRESQGSSGSSDSAPSPSHKQHKPLRKGELEVKLVGLSEEDSDCDNTEIELTSSNPSKNSMEEKIDKLLESSAVAAVWRAATDEKLNAALGVRDVVQRLERESKKKNVIVLGLEETKNKADDREDVYLSIQSLEKHMKMEGVTAIDWDDAYRLGRFQPGKTRPLLIRFLRTRDKVEFMTNKKILKGTAIRVKDDETEEQRAARTAFKAVYENEWLTDNSVRRLIKNGRMILFKSGKLHKVYGVRNGKVEILVTQAQAVGSPLKVAGSPMKT